jgi:predicted transcriptional regulator
MPGGALEEAVLNALWDLGRASTREVYERVGEPGGLVYTTVAKVLDRLVGKRLVTRTRRGNTFLHRAAVTREDMTRARLDDLLTRVLGPAPMPAIASLVDAVESVDPELLDELSRLIELRRRSRDGS